MATKTTTATANTTLIECLAKITIGAALLIPGMALAVFGWAHFRDGLARDAAIPVPVYMVAEIPVPQKAYTAAAEALSRADHRNGLAMIEQAEARQRAGQQTSDVIPLLEEGLRREPASPRGWTLLSESLFLSNKAAAARALSQALVLAPRDFWLIGRRARDAALMWWWLDADSRDLALAQTRLLWSEPSLHMQLRQLLETHKGEEIITRAFEDDDIRAINRWYAGALRRRRGS